MSDLIGFDAEPSDVATLLHNLFGDDLAEPDWLVRYTRLTAQQALVDGVVSAIKVERGRALAAGKATGLTLDQIAGATSLGSYQRVQQLIAAGGSIPC